MRRGGASWGSFLVEALEGQTNLLPTALAAGELPTARAIFEHSFGGNALRDHSVAASWERCIRNFAPFAWATEEGHRCASYESWLLQTRALRAVLYDEVDAALGEWLPPPAELLRIARHESWWKMYLSGAAHPALLCASLHGRLGAWEAAAEVAEGVLELTPFNRLVRVEALRLLARCHGAAGERAAACEALERAVGEAQRAGYVWMELVVLLDLLERVEAGGSAADDVRARLRRCSGAMRATPAELATVVGGGDGGGAQQRLFDVLGVTRA